jgi:hypothetical protein
MIAPRLAVHLLTMGTTKQIPHAQWTRTFGNVFHEHRRRVSRFEWRVAGEHVIANNAERIQIIGHSCLV